VILTKQNLASLRHFSLHFLQKTICQRAASFMQNFPCWVPFFRDSSKFFYFVFHFFQKIPRPAASSKPIPSKNLRNFSVISWNAPGFSTFPILFCKFSGAFVK